VVVVVVVDEGVCVVEGVVCLVGMEEGGELNILEDKGGVVGVDGLVGVLGVVGLAMSSSSSCTRGSGISNSRLVCLSSAITRERSEELSVSSLAISSSLVLECRERKSCSFCKTDKSNCKQSRCASRSATSLRYIVSASALATARTRSSARDVIKVCHCSLFCVALTSSCKEASCARAAERDCCSSSVPAVSCSILASFARNSS